MNLSQHVTLAEATRSQIAARYGLDNTPPDDVLPAMRAVAMYCYEPARAHFGPIGISSFFRSKPVNATVGGSASSDHCLGRAMDLDSRDNAALFAWLRENVPFDQLIWEFGTSVEPAWVHVSYRSATENRGQVLRARRHSTGLVIYEPMEAAA